MTKTVWLAFVSVLIAMMTGCGDATPPESLTSQTMRTQAEQGKPLGVEIADLKRDNGWVDSNAPNQYIVKYTFNYHLSKSYGEAFLENAKAFEKLMAETEKKGFFGGMDTLAWTMQANLWSTQNIDAAKKDVTMLLKTCEACKAYLADLQGPVGDQRKSAMLVALYQLAEAGFNADSKVGDKAAGWIQWTFMKTEKGWQATQ